VFVPSFFQRYIVRISAQAHLQEKSSSVFLLLDDDTTIADLLSENTHTDHTCHHREESDKYSAQRSLFKSTPGPVTREQIKSTVQLNNRGKVVDQHRPNEMREAKQIVLTKIPAEILLRIPTERRAVLPLAANPSWTPTPMAIPIGVMSCSQDEHNR
jgi:hypothetical protein